MNKNYLWIGLCLFLGLVIGGSMIPSAVRALRSYDRTVDVKGLCEKEVMADKVIWPITYVSMGNNLSDVLADIDKNNETIKSFLVAGGIQDSEISISAPKISDKFASEYGANDRQYRFLGTNVVTVCTKDVKKALDLMADQSSLLKQGVPVSANEWNNQVQFNYESLNDIKPGMIEEATKNAREVALKFAKDSGSRLGKIKAASQGTFSIDSRDSNTPHIKKIRVVTYVTYYLKN